MEYSQSITQDFPYSNPITKVICGVGVVYAGYMAYKYAKASDEDPQSRKGRKRFGLNKIDKIIDDKNRASGGKVLANPDVPFYSRHNYNRRRRGV